MRNETYDRWVYTIVLAMLVLGLFSACTRVEPLPVEKTYGITFAAPGYGRVLRDDAFGVTCYGVVNISFDHPAAISCVHVNP